MKVQSLNSPIQVDVCGFEAAGDYVHMMEWLGRGPRFWEFMTSDIEAELYRQTPGAQLLSVICNEEPQFSTTAYREQNGGAAIVTAFSAVFPLILRVRTADGAIWRLNIRQGYETNNMHLDDRKRHVQVNFTVVTQQREA